MHPGAMRNHLSFKLVEYILMDSSPSPTCYTERSQLKETSIMLYLSTVQIETSMYEDTEVFQRLSAKKISDPLKLSISACQFHDSNTQRLEHVTTAPSKGCNIISTADHYHPQEYCKQLQLDIKDSYPMEIERIMFEHITMGASVAEALEIYHHNFSQAPLEDDSGDDIELF